MKKSKEDYFIYLVHSFFENETNIFTINDMFSISIEFFRNILENNKKDYLFLQKTIDILAQHSYTVIVPRRERKERFENHT